VSKGTRDGEQKDKKAKKAKKAEKAEKAEKVEKVEGCYEYEAYAPGTLRLEDVDLSQKADPETYEDELEKLQRKVYALSVSTFLSGHRAVLAFEGWDAAGKGGAIKRVTALMDPRGYKVWPIAAPHDEEARQHYLWRFWQRLPEKGEIAIFDRSWYGRVLVERVEGFARKREWKRAYGEINAFERMLTDDGVRLIKFFLHIDKKTQLERFKAREHDKLKKYKIGEEDWRNRNKWDEYQEAIQEMVDRTHRPDAPWVLVAADDKKHARLEVLRRTIALLNGKE
jgi:polyphosphate kinase 2 (PPK2 family)